jgi:hypothetical protein
MVEPGESKQPFGASGPFGTVGTTLERSEVVFIGTLEVGVPIWVTIVEMSKKT